MGSTKKGWSYSVGERGRNRVRAYEDNKTGIIMLEFYEGRPGSIEPTRRRVSLGHRDRDQAKQQADEAAAKLGKAEPVRPQELTLQTLFESYLGEVTPLKSEGKRGHDLRAAKMFLRFFGPNRLAHTLNVRDWDRFSEASRRGRDQRRSCAQSAWDSGFRSSPRTAPDRCGTKRAPFASARIEDSPAHDSCSG